MLLQLFYGEFIHNVIIWTAIVTHFLIGYHCHFVVLLPFGDRLFKYLPDPLDFDKIGSVAADIIAERTKENGNRKDQVSWFIFFIDSVQ